VQACQWCARRAPASVECKYRLALSLGLQAREHRTTASDALSKMVTLLEEVIATDPRLDEAGGHRVLGLVLLRAPGWPGGPGDQEAALEHARKADEIYPDNADNLMVLGEALAATGSTEQARTVYKRAEAIARTKAAAGDPDAREVVDAAVKALKDLR
jgi:tetratricopeptide (TPR) repeat protein